MIRILVVDRHDEDRERLRTLFAAAPFEVDVAASGHEAMELLSTTRVDAVVVDPDMKDGDGIEFVRHLAQDEQAIVFVVANDGDSDLPESAYGHGAHDVSYKPIRNELVARLRNALRDREEATNAGQRLSLMREQRACILDGRHIELTGHERDFLACLVDAPRHFATYRKLIEAVWGDANTVETQYVRVLAAQVRRKVSGPDDKPLIDTVVGEGYRLDI